MCRSAAFIEAAYIFFAVVCYYNNIKYANEQLNKYTMSFSCQSVLVRLSEVAYLWAEIMCGNTAPKRWMEVVARATGDGRGAGAS